MDLNYTFLNITYPEPDPFFTKVRELHYVYEYALATISTILNGCVVYLALTTKNATMKNYCWVLLMSVTGDMIYTTLNFITMMIVEIRAGKMWFITTGYFIHHEYPYNMLMSSLYLTGLYVTIMTIMVQFLYRYEALCKRDLTIRRFFKLYGMGLTWCVIQGFTTWPCFDKPTEEDTIILKGHPMYTYDTPSYVNANTSNLITLIHFTSSQMTIVALYTVVIITGRRIHKVLNSSQLTMSKNTRDAQRKLSMVMMLQATYPGIIVGIPVILGCGMTQLKFDVLWAGMYFVTSISLIPLANSITVLLVIPSFRKRLFKYIGGKATTISSTSGDSIIRGNALEREAQTAAW